MCTHTQTQMHVHTYAHTVISKEIFHMIFASPYACITYVSFGLRFLLCTMYYSDIVTHIHSTLTCLTLSPLELQATKPKQKHIRNNNVKSGYQRSR